MLDDQKLTMSTGGDGARERELISIARDWPCLLRSEYFFFFVIQAEPYIGITPGFPITTYVSNTKSTLIERISCYVMTFEFPWVAYRGSIVVCHSVTHLAY